MLLMTTMMLKRVLQRVYQFIYMLIVPFLTGDGDSDDSDAKPSFKKSVPKQEAEKFAKVGFKCHVQIMEY